MRTACRAAVLSPLLLPVAHAAAPVTGAVTAPTNETGAQTTEDVGEQKQQPTAKDGDKPELSPTASGDSSGQSTDAQQGMKDLSRQETTQQNSAEVPEDPVPPIIRQMLEAALASGDSGELATIVKYARRAHPAAEEAIEEMVADHKKQVEEHRLASIQQASPLALWAGKVELGGFRSTGSSSEFGINTALSATRKGLIWTHALVANADYREANGKTSSERILASYSPTMRLDMRNFLYGLVQYERDPIVGYDYRYTGSFGVGYTFVDSDAIMLSATLGPSLRKIAYTEDKDQETKFGGRSSLNFKWVLNPAFSVQQTASAFAEDDTASVISRTALDARIITKLSARFSYNMQYESGSKLTDRSFDTTSRVTLIYDF